MEKRQTPIWVRLGVSFIDWVDFKLSCAKQGLKGENVLKAFIESQAKSYRAWLQQNKKRG